MRQIARALLAQRQALAEKPLADGSPRFSQSPSFVEEADLGGKDKAYPLVSIRVEPAPSSVRAMVPARVFETVTVLADEASLAILDEVSGRLFEGLQERAFFGFDATIHRATWAGTKYLPGLANERSAVTTWDVLASWRDR